MTAPERIFAFDYDLQDETGNWKNWQVWTEAHPRPLLATEYVRADLYDKLKDALHELTASRDTWTPVSQDAIATQSEAAPDNFDALVADAVAEAMRAMNKFPQPNYVISKIAEEAGEVVKAAIHCAEGRETAQNLRDEMKQLIAMLYRLWIEGDGVHNLGSVSAALIDKEPQP